MLKYSENTINAIRVQDMIALPMHKDYSDDLAVYEPPSTVKKSHGKGGLEI